MWFLIHRYKNDILISIILFLTPLFLPLYGDSLDLSVLAGVASTIFAIFAGFLIADAMSNYLRLQTLLAEEDSALMTIADNAKQIDDAGSQNVYNAIDDYLIMQLDLGTLHHFEKTQKNIDNLHKSIHELKVSEQSKLLYDHILSMEEKIIVTRQEMSLSSQKTLTFVHWIALGVLAFLVGATVLTIRHGTLLLNLITGLTIVGIYLVITILKGMDNNTFLEYKLAYQNARGVFHAIGRPPYYPLESAIEFRRPDEEGNLRLGKK